MGLVQKVQNFRVSPLVYFPLYAPTNTGHAEDLEITEKILDELYGLEYISKTNLDAFYEHTRTKRWD